MTQFEFLLIVRWTMHDFFKFCKGQSFSQIMVFRYQFAKACALYARHHKMDAVQEKYLAIQSKLEKWCKNAFIERRIHELIRGRPGLAKTPSALKALAREDWEAYNRDQSY